MNKIQLFFSILNNSVKGKEVTGNNYSEIFENIQQKETLRYKNLYVEIEKNHSQIDYFFKGSFLNYTIYTILTITILIGFIGLIIFLINYIFDVLLKNVQWDGLDGILNIFFIFLTGCCFFLIKPLTHFLIAYRLAKKYKSEMVEFQELVNSYKRNKYA